MPEIKHSHNCKHFGENYQRDDYNNDDSPIRDTVVCHASNFEDWLPHIAPDMFWYYIESVGSYQGSVYGVAKYNSKIAIYHGYYGSCSSCGAWGEGGEPENQSDVLKNCTLFDNQVDAYAHLAKMNEYESPDIDRMISAIEEISNDI